MRKLGAGLLFVKVPTVVCWIDGVRRICAAFAKTFVTELSDFQGKNQVKIE